MVLDGLVRISCRHPKGSSALDAEETVVRHPVLFDSQLVLLEMIVGIDGVADLEVVGGRLLGSQHCCTQCVGTSQIWSACPFVNST
jgi:hypothetical protein